MNDDINYTAPPKLRNANGGNGTLNFPQLKFGRSIGLKLMLVCALVLLMGIPAAMIAGVSFERANRASDVQREVSARYGGPQTVMGPMIVAPFTQWTKDGEILRTGEYVLFPEDGSAAAQNITSDTKKRSLYRVTTYNAQIEYKARFDMPDMNLAAESDGRIDWTQARLVIGMNNVGGLAGDVKGEVGGRPLRFEPGLSFVQNVPDSDGAPYTPDYAKNFLAQPGVADRTGQQLMSTAYNPDVMGKSFDVSIRLPIGGAERLSFMPFAKTTQISLSGDWPHPGFAGKFAPKTSDVTEQGFSAKWYVPYLARGMNGQGSAHMIGFDHAMMNGATVNFVEMVGPYQTVNRALKYSIVFIGLIFMSYFLFEIMLCVRVHPAQYILIGLVQAIFYLLLLSLAEHIGFVAAYALSALATIGVTSSYAAAVFGGRKYALSAAAVFSAVYGLQFVLLQVGDFALLIGAMTSFGAVTATLYLTRGLNWYGDNAGLKTASKTA